MKTIDLSHTSPDIDNLLAQARQDDLVVRLADGTEFILIALDEFDQEIAKSRNNPRLIALLKERATQTATVPLEEVKQRLKL